MSVTNGAMAPPVAVGGWGLVKRPFDLCVAIPALVVLAPLMAVIALAIRLDSRGPAIFRQTRIGRHSKPFGMIKFRTMRPDAHAGRPALADLNEGLGGLFKIGDDPRLTRVGRFLRRSALDELPQLVNVVRGEMSLVGPRPLVPEEDRLIEGDARRRLEVRPGMTGYWQVWRASHDRISLEELLRLDESYLRECSLATDLRLLWRTAAVAVSRKGI